MTRTPIHLTCRQARNPASPGLLAVLCSLAGLATPMLPGLAFAQSAPNEPTPPATPVAAPAAAGPGSTEAVPNPTPAQPSASQPAVASDDASAVSVTPKPAPGADSTPAPAAPGSDAARSAIPERKLEIAVPASDAERGCSERECRRWRREQEAAEGSGWFLLGLGAFDISSLNDRLADSGYERLEGAMTIIGGGGQAVFDSGFVVGGHGAAILGPDGDAPGALRTELSGGYGMLDLGFALTRSPHFLLSLTSGIGGWGWSLDISDRQSDDFDDVLEDPARTSSMSHGGLLTGLTLAASGRVPVSAVEDGQRGFFTLGARITALYGIGFGEWDLNGYGTATGGPSGNLAGVHAALAIGFGGSQVDDPNDP